jgi:hypothetical protein
MYILGVSLSEVGSLVIQNSHHCMGDDDQDEIVEYRRMGVGRRYPEGNLGT